MKWKTAYLAAALSAVALQAGAEYETRRIVGGEQCRAGRPHRLMLRDEYRGLWTAPVELPVLDLHSFAGGLSVVRLLGHGQTKALALKGADGNAYTFRPILKDPSGLLPPELRES